VMQDLFQADIIFNAPDQVAAPFLHC
jgi:hypothetical protein